jgi:UPF0271 protein
VLDTSALIMGLDPLGLELETYSVPEVTDELRDQTGPSYRLAVSTAGGRLKIRAPTAASIEEITERANMLGDRMVLSKADLSVLALALDLRGEGKEPVVVSDDYAVQNVAEGMNVAYQPLATLGIRQRFKWTSYCPACFRRYAGGNLRVCQVCGTELRRKPLRKRAAKARLQSMSVRNRT